jgi:hypothetical protein
MQDACCRCVRADARWVGVGVVAGEGGREGGGEEVVLGVSDRGTVYAVRHAERMAGKEGGREGGREGGPLAEEETGP